jgi:hypothetical protein
VATNWDKPDKQGAHCHNLVSERDRETQPLAVMGGTQAPVSSAIIPDT